jgi:hypothetical protein
MNTAIAPQPARIPAQAPDQVVLLPAREPRGAPVASGIDPPALNGAELVAAADLRALMLAFPVGSRLRFHGYHPAIWPRDWRRAAERSPWGLRPDDLLEMTGYGTARGFPDALLARRVRDGTTAMIFPPEVEPVGPADGRSPVPVMAAAPATLPADGPSAAEVAQQAQQVRAAQDWADDGGRLCAL